MTSELNTIRNLVSRLAPEAVCDTCVAARLEGADAGDVAPLVRELVALEGFELVKQPCAMCCETGLAVRKAGRSATMAGAGVWAHGDQRRRA